MLIAMEQNLDSSMSTEVHQITTFADDTPVISGAKLMPASSSSWKSFAEENRNHGILDVLSRPVLLTTSTSLWSTSKVANQFPTEASANSVFTFPSAILNKSPNIVKKLEGFTYFRANVKIRVMVNAQAFSQGKLWIWFSPYELASGTQFAADNLSCKTGYPGVELDVASGQPAEFTIPYCAPMSHYCLTSGEGTMGDLLLTVLSPLTISDASLSVFAWFEDIDLQLPTGVPMGDPPSPVFQLASQGGIYIDTTTNTITSSLWGGDLLCDGIATGYTAIPFLIVSKVSPANFIVIPAGIQFTVILLPVPETSPSEYNVQITTVTGFSGFLVSESSSSTSTVAYSCTYLNGSGNCYYWLNGHELLTPNYIFLRPTDGASYSPTVCSLPEIYAGIVDQTTQTIDYLASFADIISVFGQNAKLQYYQSSGYPAVKSTEAVYLLTNTFTRTESGSALVSVTATATPSGTYYMKVSQSDDSAEEEWYKNYPVAQISESEHQAISSLVTSSLGKVIAGSTPMLASLKTPLSWISRLGTAVAAGYSKPIDVEKSRCVYELPAKGFTHGEGPDNSVSLGVIPDNSLGIEPTLFSTSIDELDISYVTKKSCYLRSDTWSTTSTGRIFSFFVGPGISTIDATGYQSTLLSYITSMFRFWHGTIRYRISVAKTGFHTGRLRISFHPGACGISEVFNADNAYSWILDLSTSSEIDIEIPYVTPKPWLIADLFDKSLVDPYGPTSTSGGSIAGSNNLNYFTGVLQIEVLNQLRSAGAASSTVDILTWISAGDSFELAVPSFSNFRPVTDSYPVIPSEVLRSKRFVSEQDEQVEEEEEIPEAQAFQTITDASSHTEQLDGASFSQFFNSNSSFSNASTLCIGEKVSNLRVLLKRFTPYVFKSAGTATVDACRVTIDPAYFGVVYPPLDEFDSPFEIITSSGVLLGSYTNCESPIEYVSKLYRFFSGSRRYKCFSGNSATGDSAIQQFSVRGYLETTLQVNGAVSHPIISGQDSNASNFCASSGSFSHFVDGVNNKCCEVSVPYYSQTPIQCISNGTSFPQADDYIMRYKLIFDSGASASNQSKTFVIYQAAGDDFNFGYLIGAPNLRRLKVAATYN